MQNALVIADMSMSLDGYIAKRDDDAMPLFDWFFNGDTEVQSGDPAVSFRTTEESADVLREAQAGVGAIVGGRKYFDLAEGWGGEPPMGVPMFIVTHRPPPETYDKIHFVTEGVEAAIELAREAAGGKTVGLATPTVTKAAHAAGLLDGLSVNLIPILLGDGIPWFEGIDADLEDPQIIPGRRVTHLYYRVKK